MGQLKGAWNVSNFKVPVSQLFGKHAMPPSQTIFIGNFHPSQGMQSPLNIKPETQQRCTVTELLETPNVPADNVFKNIIEKTVVTTKMPKKTRHIQLPTLYTRRQELKDSNKQFYNYIPAILKEHQLHPSQGMQSPLKKKPGMQQSCTVTEVTNTPPKTLNVPVGNVCKNAIEKSAVTTKMPEKTRHVQLPTVITRRKELINSNKPCYDYKPTILKKWQESDYLKHKDLFQKQGKLFHSIKSVKY